MVKETQNFLNYLIDARLVVDGVHGLLTNSASKRGVDYIKKKFKLHNFKFDPHFNFIGIRTSNEITNKFTDWFVVANNQTLVAVPASTKAGLPAVWKYANRWIRGVKGFGTIVENQQIDYILVKPNKKSIWSMWSGGLGFLYQDKPISVYRDQNTDLIVDTTTMLRDDINNGFNVHSWSTAYGFFVNNLSEGCQVCQRKYWSYLFSQFVKYSTVDNRVMYTLLQW